MTSDKAKKKPIPVYGIREFSAEEKTAYFYSNDLSVHLEAHKFVNAPHKHSTYITILFTKGSGKHLIDFQTYPVKPGSVFLLNPGQVHSWTLSSDVEGFVFFHTKEFFDEIFINRKIADFPFFYLQQNHPFIDIPASSRHLIENLFQMINDEYKGKSEFKMPKLGSLVDLVYLQLSEFYKPKEKVKGEAVSNYLKARKLLKLIDEHFKVRKSPSEYADMMNMSIRHLNRICQDSLNSSTGDLIFERIILEAKRMLIHNDITISQVAEQLGYEDYSYFIRLFKKKVGESPKEFQFRMTKPFN